MLSESNRTRRGRSGRAIAEGAKEAVRTAETCYPAVRGRTLMRSALRRRDVQPGARRRAVVLGVVVLVASGMVAVGGCEKRERPGAPAPPAGKPAVSTPATAKAPASSANSAGEFTIEVDAAGEVVRVVGKKDGKAPLTTILEKAYQTDKQATGKTVKSWMTDNDVLTTQDVRDLLEASWQKDSKEATQALRSWFVERMTLEISDIPALLTKAWDYDQGNTRDILRTWGDSYGFVDVSDAESLDRHKFVVADDIDQIRKAVRDHHGSNWTKVAGIPLATATPEGAEEISVKISWASQRWIGSKELRFRSDDERFSAKENMVITLAPRNLPSAGIPVVVTYGVDLPEDWVQVQDEDFVAIAAKLREVPVPERSSDEWDNLLRLGVVSGSVYL